MSSNSSKSTPLHLVAVSIALILAGCSDLGHRRTEERAEGGNAYPENYRSELLAFLRTYLNDPTNVRDAAIAEPVLKDVGGRPRYVACVRFNAKNRDHKYLGVKEGLALYVGGRFSQFLDSPREMCQGATYQPFPELQALTR